jgi:hypothetical protein
LVLATEERDVVAVYLPALGEARLPRLAGRAYQAQWYDPRTGELFAAMEDVEKGWYCFVAPPGFDDKGRPWDWVLVLHQRAPKMRDLLRVP